MPTTKRPKSVPCFICNAPSAPGPEPYCAAHRRECCVYGCHRAGTIVIDGLEELEKATESFVLTCAAHAREVTEVLLGDPLGPPSHAVHTIH